MTLYGYSLTGDVTYEEYAVYLYDQTTQTYRTAPCRSSRIDIIMGFSTLNFPHRPFYS